MIGLNPNTGQLTIGHRVTSQKTKSCAVGPKHDLTVIPLEIKTAVQLFENHFRSTGRKPYDPKDQSGFWRKLVLRSNLEGQILAYVIVHPQDLTIDDMEQIKTNLRSLIQGTPISSLYFQAASNNPVQMPPIEHLSGLTHLVERLCDLELTISPLAYFQVS